MYLMANEKCEFCGQIKNFVISTTFSGCYCKDCLSIVIDETQDAIGQIEEMEGQLC